MKFTLKHYDTPLLTFLATMDTSTPELEILWHNPERLKLIEKQIQKRPRLLLEA